MKIRTFCPKGGLILISGLAGVMLLVSTALFSIPFTGAQAQGQCPSNLRGVIDTQGDYNLVLDRRGYQMQIPLHWDSVVINDQWTFYPCENPDVRITLAQFTVYDSSKSTEQLAIEHIQSYAPSIDGYRVIGSEYIDGSQEYSVDATAGGSELPTIWHGYIRMTGWTGPELFVTTFSAGSPELYDKYGDNVRYIFDNIKPVSESMVNKYLSLVDKRGQIWTDAMTNIQKDHQESIDTAIKNMGEDTVSDYYVEKGKYDNCQRNELGVNWRC